MFHTGTEFALLVENMGIGPAQVRGVQVSVDGRPARGWNEVLGQISRHGAANVSRSSLSSRVIPAGQSIRVLQLHQREQAKEFAAASARLRMRICYCSVYEDCWILAANLGDETAEMPRPVERCPAAMERSFVN